VRTAAIVGVATPNFVLAVLLILIFAVGLRVVPISGAPLLLRDPAQALPYYVLPTITLGVGYAALMARILRASMLEVLVQDYVRVARAKGLHTRTVLWVHALKNSLIPLITVLAVNFAYLLGGAAIMEQVFGLPGLGSLMIRAALERDYPVIQGISLFVALVFILANLTADFLYSVIDPRIRHV
jgi:peptide/nickel transport system permease protein